MPNDRCVHAVTANGCEVVRYDRAGKWYLEHPDDPRKRERIDVLDAVRIATQEGATANLGLPGGKRFDAEVFRICDADVA